MLPKKFSANFVLHFISHTHSMNMFVFNIKCLNYLLVSAKYQVQEDVQSFIFVFQIDACLLGRHGALRS